MASLIRQFISKTKCTVIWKKQKKDEIRKLNNIYRNVNELNLQGATLVLAPHSDDEWVGCSQVLLRHNNVSICYMNKAGGNTENIRSLRLDEIKSTAARCENVLYIANNTQELIDVIQKVRPNTIFVPYYIDWHLEHIEVMETLKEALKMFSDFGTINIAMYPVSVPMASKKINAFIPMSKSDLRDKWRYFQEN